jgi:heat shock protein HtpX
VTLQEQIRQNRLRTALLLVLFAIPVAALAAAAALAVGPDGLVLVGVVAIAYGIFSWFACGRMIAAAAGARPAAPGQHPQARRALDTVAIAAGLPVTPPLYVVDDPAPNAFAAGRDPAHAFVAVTTGLLETMPRRELEGVLAHEISHVRNRDVRLMSLAAVLVGVIALASDLLLRVTLLGGGRGRDRRAGALPFAALLAAAVLAPLGATLLQLALSRRREFQADASAAEITGDAEGMALALKRLLVDPRPTRRINTATAHLYIESPIRQEPHRRRGAALFDTHPSLEDRIARLEQAGGFSLARDARAAAPAAPAA